MYKSGLNIMPWPIFNDAEWFRSLAKVKRILDKQEAKYENARIFLQSIKVIMAKLKVGQNFIFNLKYIFIFCINKNSYSFIVGM